jgi:hypothetical protein
VLGAKSLDELLVGVLVAVLVQDTHVSLATVEGLGGLTETTGETVVDEGVAEDTLERVLDGHLALVGSIGGDLDLLGGLNLGDLNAFFVRDAGSSGGPGQAYFLSYVRHF